jgi:hypothetical protein
VVGKFGVDTPGAVPTALLLLRTALCGRRVREGREKTPCGSKGRFFPHLQGKSLILRKSRTISSEPRLFNKLNGIFCEIFFLSRYLRHR